MNRRADTDLTGSLTWQLISLVIAVLTIVAFSGTLAKLLGFGGNVDSATEASFGSMRKVIDEQVKSPLPFISNGDQPQPFYLGKDYVMVGFNKGEISQSWSAHGCDSFSFEILGKQIANAVNLVQKPDICGTSACICLYTSESAVEKREPTSCKTVEVDYILSLWYSDANAKTDTEIDLSGVTTVSRDTIALVPTTKAVTANMQGQCYPWTPGAYQQLLPGTVLNAKRCSTLTEAESASKINAYASLVFFGKCVPGFGVTPFGTQPIYIETSSIRGESFLLVSAELPKDIREQRQNKVFELEFKRLFDEAEVIRGNLAGASDAELALMLKNYALLNGLVPKDANDLIVRNYHNAANNRLAMVCGDARLGTTPQCSGFPHVENLVLLSVGTGPCTVQDAFRCTDTTGARFSCKDGAWVQATCAAGKTCVNQASGELGAECA